MEAVVDPETCTGCGLCADECPEVFSLPGEVAQGGPVPADQEDCAQRMVDECPVAAISVQ